jgi:hypothetical protein
VEAPGPDIRTHREGLLLHCLVPIHSEQHRAAALVLVHQARVLEVGHQRGPALDASIADVADLLRVEVVPLAVIKPEWVGTGAAEEQGRAEDA